MPGPDVPCKRGKAKPSVHRWSRWAGLARPVQMCNLCTEGVLPTSVPERRCTLPYRLYPAVQFGCSGQFGTNWTELEVAEGIRHRLPERREPGTVAWFSTRSCKVWPFSDKPCSSGTTYGRGRWGPSPPSVQHERSGDQRVGDSGYAVDYL